LAGLDNGVLSPTLGDVLAARDAFGESPWLSLAEDSPLPRLIITPGALILTRTSSRQLVRTAELAQVARVATVNAAALFLADDPGWHPKDLPGREITAWSAQSRVNMVRTFASLDWGPVHQLADAGRVLAMVTLTYPADWETVAPDGKTVKAQLRVWKERYRRAWGEPIVAAWKFEFQHRGAPHFHLLLAPPHGRARGRGVGAGFGFHHWLGLVWADIVNHPDPVEYQKHLAVTLGPKTVSYSEALKCSDPKRLAVYFSKHGQWRSKEYQHNVPELWREPGKGPGRYWGYWGLKPLAAAVELSDSDRQLAARILRRHADRIRAWDCSRANPCPGRRHGPACRLTWDCGLVQPCSGRRHRAGCCRRYECERPHPCPGGQHRQGCRQRYTRALRPGKERWRDIDPVSGDVVHRTRRRRARVRRFTSGAGFLVVNDAPRLAHDLARAIQVCGDRQ
jgi:hypothetical protein